MGDIEVRLLSMDDADELGKLYQRNLSLFSLDEPSRKPDFFTAEGQRAHLQHALREHAEGRCWPAAICADGMLIGKGTLFNIQHGPLLTCAVGGWVAQERSSRGVATEGLRLLLRIAFQELALHKVEGYAQITNVASRTVLERNQFEQVGTLRRHVYDSGQWHDQVLYERIAPWCDGTRFTPSGCAENTGTGAHGDGGVGATTDADTSLPVGRGGGGRAEQDARWRA